MEWLAAADLTIERVPLVGPPLVVVHSLLAVLSEVAGSHQEALLAVVVADGPTQGFRYHSLAFITGPINCGESTPCKATVLRFPIAGI